MFRPDGAWGIFVGGVSTKISLRTERGRNRVAVENVGGMLTQDSACRATLGFGAECRWDSQTARATDGAEAKRAFAALMDRGKTYIAKIKAARRVNIGKVASLFHAKTAS